MYVSFFCIALGYLNGGNAVQLVNMYFINAYMPFGIAFKKVKSLTVAGKVIVFLSVDNYHHPVRRSTKVFVSNVIVVLVIYGML